MMCFAVYDAFLQKYSRHSKLWMPHLLWWLDLFTVHACHCIWSLHCITFSLLFTTFFCSSRRQQWIGNSLLSQRVFANLLFQHFANHSNHHIGMSMIIEHGYNDIVFSTLSQCRSRKWPQVRYDRELPVAIPYICIWPDQSNLGWITANNHNKPLFSQTHDVRGRFMVSVSSRCVYSEEGDFGWGYGC